MAGKSKIEWTESTWNPVTGCTKISIGCRNCYAERFALRLKAAGSRNYADGLRLYIVYILYITTLYTTKKENIVSKAKTT